MERVMNAVGMASEACDRSAGHVAFWQACARLAGLAVVILVNTMVLDSLSSSKRIKTHISSVLPDTHALHVFPWHEMQIHPRTIRKQRSVPKNGRQVTEEYTTVVYDVTNLIAPDGGRLNDLIGLPYRPTHSEFPVRLHRGSVNGGTVEPQSTNWNPCLTTLDHRGTLHEDIPRPHSDKCSTLVGNTWKVYLQEDGTILPDNFSQMFKAGLMTAALVAKILVVREIAAMALLFSNGFYQGYGNVATMEDGSMGAAAQRFQTLWRQSFTLRNSERCLQVAGKGLNALGMNRAAAAAQSVQQLPGALRWFKDTISACYLFLLSRSDRKLEAVSTGSLIRAGLIVLLVRTILYLLLLRVIYKGISLHIFQTILKTEEDLDRTRQDYMVALVCSAAISFALKEYVFLFYDAALRRQFRSRVLRNADSWGISKSQLEDFVANFPVVDHASLAL